MKKFYKENKALSLSLIICAGLVLLYPWVLIFIWPIPFVIVLLKKLSPRIDKWGTKVDKIIQSTSKKIDSFGEDKVSKRIKATSNKLEKKPSLVKDFAKIAVGLVILVVGFNLLFPSNETSGTKIYEGGRKYVGELKNDKPHGQGTITYDGNKYVGEWKDGELQNQPVEKNAKSETLQVSDILLDIQTLKGKSVEVKGFYLNVGQMAFLYEKAGSLNFISVETKNADRETRKYLLKSCSTGCEIKVKGILSEEYGMITMDLESIKK